MHKPVIITTHDKDPYLIIQTLSDNKNSYRLPLIQENSNSTSFDILTLNQEIDPLGLIDSLLPLNYIIYG